MCQVPIAHTYYLYSIFCSSYYEVHTNKRTSCTCVQTGMNNILCINISKYIYYKPSPYLQLPRLLYRWLVPTRRAAEAEVRWTEPCDLRGSAIAIVTARSTNTDPASMLPCIRLPLLIPLPLIPLPLVPLLLIH